jgi:hypothetical protein
VMRPSEEGVPDAFKIRLRQWPEKDWKASP